MFPRLAMLGVLLAACASQPVGPPTPSAPVAAASPSRPVAVSPSAAPTGTRSPIPLPSSAFIVAPTGTVVWTVVAGERIFVSDDRGDSWSERSLPQIGGVAISFIDARTGWSLLPDGIGVPAGASGCPARAARLWRTADGAMTWQPVDALGADALCKDAVAFTDLQRGFLSGSGSGAVPVIYRTADGGHTWNASQPLPAPPGSRLGAVRGFGGTLLVLAVLAGPSVPGTARRAYRSTDGGASWADAGAASDGVGDVAFVTATRWLQITSPGAATETTDGGASWHAFSTDYAQAAPVPPVIAFGDGEVGYATVRGSIQRSTDGGAHWLRIRTPGTF